MNKEWILELIERNNDVVKTVNKFGNVEIGMNALFPMMEINCAFTRESSYLTHIAREMGIDAKYNAQSGEITVYGEIKED